MIDDAVGRTLTVNDTVSLLLSRPLGAHPIRNTSKHTARKEMVSRNKKDQTFQEDHRAYPSCGVVAAIAVGHRLSTENL